MFRYCEKGWKWLFLTMIALSVVACGDDTDDFSGSAVWRTSSTVGAAEGSAAIQIEGPVGAGWRAEIKDGGAWCSFRLNDPTVLVKEGTVQSSNISNILDVYYTANTGSGERSATIEFEFFGGEPQVLVLTQFSASSTNDPYDEGHAKAWAELPEKRVDENFVYVSHFASLNNRTVRNYSFCYDKTLHVAHWVAYPLHSVYRGSIDRTDDFQYDPKVDYSWQPNLAAGSYRGSYDRGHQLPSADRTATRELNLQTFYATNMTPQLNRLNQDMWANLEAKVRAQICNDTLYVVTGCYYANTNTTTTDRDGKVCPVPTNYFKVLLRTRTGTTGKRIADCSADELKAIGFWVDQKSYGDIQPPASICMSVAEIEKKTGFTFHFGCRVESVEKRADGVVVRYRTGDEEKEAVFDRLMVSIGRVPALQSVNPEAVGLKADARGFVEVDEGCRTNLPGVYAIGDLVRGPMLAHKASDEGVAVAEEIAGEHPVINHRLVPSVIYTHPEIAWVGLTEAEARNEGYTAKAGKAFFSANGRARAQGQTDGFVKIVADAENDRVLGIHILGSEAGELIAAASFILATEATCEDVALTTIAHPTFAEAIREAALTVLGRPMNS